MCRKKQLTNLILDAALFSVFLSSFLLKITGVAAHQWLGILVGFMVLAHILTHLNWLKTVTGCLYKTNSRRTQLYYIVDILLLPGFIMILATGLHLSTWLNLPMSGNRIVYQVHIISSVGTLLLAIIKLALHWRWILLIGSRILNPINRDGRIPSAISNPAQSRREFLTMMGVITSAGILVSIDPLIQLVRSMQEEFPGEAMGSEINPLEIAYEYPKSATPTNQAEANMDLEQGSSTTRNNPQTEKPILDLVEPTPTGAVEHACVVQCSRGCSYPGHCRRYIDANGNQLCDKGECL